MKKEIYLAFIICLLFGTNSYAACTCKIGDTPCAPGVSNTLNKYVKESADSNLRDSYYYNTCVITKNFHPGGEKLRVSGKEKSAQHITVTNNNSTYHVFKYAYQKGDYYGSSNKKVESTNIGKYAATRNLM